MVCWTYMLIDNFRHVGSLKLILLGLPSSTRILSGRANFKGCLRTAQTLNLIDSCRLSVVIAHWRVVIILGFLVTITQSLRTSASLTTPSLSLRTSTLVLYGLHSRLFWQSSITIFNQIPEKRFLLLGWRTVVGIENGSWGTMLHNILAIVGQIQLITYQGHLNVLVWVLSNLFKPVW